MRKKTKINRTKKYSRQFFRFYYSPPLPIFHLLTFNKMFQKYVSVLQRKIKTHKNTRL